MNDELDELRQIKKLMILLCRANDVDQREIAKVLGVTESAISHMLKPKAEKNV